MASMGFEEARSRYESAPPEIRIGQFRRFGSSGPAYEVIGLSSGLQATIRVIGSGEKMDYSIERVKADPLAVTIP